MIKPKVWLVENGHAPKGYENSRGRMPQKYKDLILEAVSNGVQIEGFALVASTGPTPAPPTVEKAPINSGEKVIADLAYRYSEDDFILRENVSGIERSMREACRRCGCSVVGCWCPSPLIVALDARGDVAVTVHSRKEAR